MAWRRSAARLLYVLRMRALVVVLVGIAACSEHGSGGHAADALRSPDGLLNCIDLQDDVGFVFATPNQTCVFSTEGLDPVFLNDGPDVADANCGDCHVLNESQPNGDGNWKAQAIDWNADPGFFGEAVQVQPDAAEVCVWRRCILVFPE